MSSQPDPQITHAAAGRLAQLLGETIVHHAPWTSQVDAETRRRVTDEWLDGLEAHTAGFVGPFLQQILDNSDPPDAVKALFAEAIEPTAAFSAVLEQIFLYGIVNQVIGAAVSPFLQEVSNQLWASAVSTGVNVPTPPSVIATAAGRGLELGSKPTVTVPDWAYEQAAQSGISRADVDLQASIVGLPPALQELFELYRRGVINESEVREGLREGDFRDDWIDRTVNLVHSWLTPLDFVRAAVQAQMTYADAQEWATKTGLDTSTSLPLETSGTEATPDMFGLAFAIAGRPPGPAELGRMALRKIIDWTGTGADALTFQQGIAESDVKTKWTDALRKLTEYVPPPREIGTLLEHGAITKAQAVAYWEETGVPTELANGYAYVADQQHIGQDKLLAIGQVKTGYFDQIFSKEQALELLDDLGVRGDVATQTLEVIDFRREIQAINAVVKRVESLYGADKIDATHAKAALTTVGVPSDQADKLLATWGTLRVTPIHLPEPREIGAAVKFNTITQQEAIEALEALGYQPRDAAIVLSAHAEVQVTPLPAKGTTVTG